MTRFFKSFRPQAALTGAALVCSLSLIYEWEKPGIGILLLVLVIFNIKELFFSQKRGG